MTGSVNVEVAEVVRREGDTGVTLRIHVQGHALVHDPAHCADGLFDGRGQIFPVAEHKVDVPNVRGQGVVIQHDVSVLAERGAKRTMSR